MHRAGLLVFGDSKNLYGRPAAFANPIDAFFTVSVNDFECFS
jgi:hypothetical protein